MGQALAGRLLEGHHDVVIWNRTPGRAPALVEAGAHEADSVAAAVGGARVVLTSLADDDSVREVAEGEDGIRSALDAGSLYVDTSTVSPGLSAALDAAFPHFVAMPVLGSPAMVATGFATYLVGGDEGATHGLDDLLPALSDHVQRYETPALASVAKVTVNLLLLDSVVALAESFAVGRAGGLSADQLRRLLGDSPVVPLSLRNRFEGVLTGHQDPWWSPALGAKDAGLAIGLVEAEGGRLPLTSTARELYRESAADPANEDIADVTRVYRS
jgi:3-hydroxyisobutyrate dehydrogenase-like beta-hydroxyacid dehydrogenase